MKRTRKTWMVEAKAFNASGPTRSGRIYHKEQADSLAVAWSHIFEGAWEVAPHVVPWFAYDPWA